MSKRLIVVTECILATSAMGAAPKKAARPPARKPAPAVAYDFMGSRLGMTIEEWKAVPVQTYFNPDRGPDSQGLARPICSSDDDTTEAKPRQRADEATVGIVTCRYIRKLYSRETDAELVFGRGFLDTPTFKFYQGKLYEISLFGSDYITEGLLDALKQRWGAATSVTSGKVQNRLGASFPHSVFLWSNPHGFIRLESPAGDIDSMTLTYASREKAAAERALQAAAAKDLRI